MKTKKLLVAAFIAVALLLAASCTIPDYQLQWEITDCDKSGNYAIVSYTLDNTGYEKLYDVTIEIEVSTAEFNFIPQWTSPVDLSVNETKSFTTSIYIGTDTLPLASITGAAWNIDDSAF